MDNKIIEFLESYGQAIGAGDIEELEKFWDIPAVGVCDQGVVRIANRDDLRRMYVRGLDSIRPPEDDVQPKLTLEGTEIISENLIAVNIRWTAPDVSGNEQVTSHARYLLRQGADGGLHIRVAARRAA
jgi:hypothetical protein